MEGNSEHEGGGPDVADAASAPVRRLHPGLGDLAGPPSFWHFHYLYH